MKKSGFTLAEVLITLAIIGVVAAITLPALISSTQERQAITAFKKTMNTLNEVAQMNVANDGFDYGHIASSAAPSARNVYNAQGVLEQSIWGMMVTKAKVDITQSESASNGNSVGGACDGGHQIFFQDGTVLCYQRITTNSANTPITAFIDTNGRKAPNAASNCSDVTCSRASNRRISDQFRITLIGSNAIPGSVQIDESGSITEEDTPNSRASRWAMRQ